MKGNRSSGVQEFRSSGVQESGVRSQEPGGRGAGVRHALDGMKKALANVPNGRAKNSARPWCISSRELPAPVLSRDS